MSSLWVGDLDPYMDETFLTRVFASLGENVISVKSIKNKTTGGPAGYCFVDFGDAYTAERVLHKYNGAVVPGTNPVKKFKLNWAQYGKGETYQGPEYSLFVGDLTADVTDHILQEFFQRRYASCRAAKVVFDASTGASRGYGFVRFSDEVEQRRSMVEMQGINGCGGKPLRVSAATPKTRSQASTISTVTPSYGASSSSSNTNYYLQYQQYINAWQGYQQQQQQQQQYYQQYSQYGDPYQYQQQQQQQQQQAYEETITAEHTVEDPNEPLDIEALNKDAIQTDHHLYEEMEQSRWQPIESLTSAPKPVVA